MKAPHLDLTIIVAMAALLLSGCVNLPGTTTANPMLERDTLSMLMTMDRAYATDCNEREVVNREVVSADSKGAVEHWFVNRCGTLVRWKITYSPDPRGGTMIGWTPGEVVGKAPSETRPPGNGM